MSEPTRHVTGAELVKRYGHDGPPSDLAVSPPDEPPLEPTDIAADLAEGRDTPETPPGSDTKTAAGRTRRR